MLNTVATPRAKFLSMETSNGDAPKPRVRKPREPRQPVGLIKLGRMIRAHREALDLTQQEAADKVGMKRENYVQMENGHRKEPLSQPQAVAISKEMGIPMLALVNAMGFPVEVQGVKDATEAELLEAFRQASPEFRRFLLQGLGLGTE